MNKITVNSKPMRIRLAGPRGKATVDREARVIRGFSVITRGEALGHGLWIDHTFLDQVARSGRAEGRGLKARFTHPGLSGDGLGKALGRAKNFTRSGDRVYADLHLLKSASETPDGDLAGYVMDLAEEDPGLFGASIVFDSDMAAMDRFTAEHTGHGGAFKSPDDDNRRNYPHARLGRLWAADIVDDPAANPAGLFSFPAGSELAARAEGILAYALGISEDMPPELAGGPHPERARAFVQEFLARHGLKIEKEKPSDQAEAITALDGKVEELIATVKEHGAQLKRHECRFIIGGNKS